MYNYIYRILQHKNYPTAMEATKSDGKHFSMDEIIVGVNVPYAYRDYAYIEGSHSSMHTFSPIDTPPEVTTTSASSNPWDREESREDRLRSNKGSLR